MPISKREARELISRAYEMGAKVLNGIVRRREDGTWVVDDEPLASWLEDQQGSEVVLVAAQVAEGQGTRRVCRTCGTEFEGHECPHCREVHRRLRGR
jgi:rubrerythrin